MQQLNASQRFRRFVPDVLVGIAVFALVLTLAGGSSGVVQAADFSIAAKVEHHASVLLLAGTLAAVAAFNLAIFRHLCRAYAAPRRAAARRALRSGRIERT
jgi:hypothetical protein